MKTWKILAVFLLAAAISAISVVVTLKMVGRKVEVVYVDREVERSSRTVNGAALKPGRDIKQNKKAATSSNQPATTIVQTALDETSQLQENGIPDESAGDMNVRDNLEKWEASITSYLSGGEKSAAFRGGSGGRHGNDNGEMGTSSSSGGTSGGGYAGGGDVGPFISNADAGGAAEFTSAEKTAVAESFAKLSVGEQREEIQHTLNLLDHEDMPIIDSIMLDAKTDTEVLDIIFNNILNRPANVKAEALRKIANTAGHPYAGKADEFLKWTDQ